jgi:hypothetical protein
MSGPGADARPLYADWFSGPASLDKIEELVRCCERRIARATEKLACAEAESTASKAAYERALAARADWIVNTPDAQLMML